MTEVPRIDKDDLREMLDSPDVFVVDLRSEEQWQNDAFKVERAVHEDRDNLSSWADKYDRDKTLILYCA